MGFVRFNCGGLRCHSPQPSICFSCWRLLSLSPAAEMNVWLHLSCWSWQGLLQPPGRRDSLHLSHWVASQSHSGMSTWLHSGGGSPWHKQGALPSSSSCPVAFVLPAGDGIHELGSLPLATQDNLDLRMLVAMCSLIL